VESALFNMVVSLAGVLFLMVGLSYVVKKYFGASPASKDLKISIDILGHKMLQPKQSVFVIQVWNKVFVLSSTEQRLQLISEITDEELLVQVVGKDLQTSTAPQSIFDSTRKFVAHLPSVAEIFKADKRNQNIKSKRAGSGME
jgi:flagellar biogenesis protein FliO